MIRFYEEMSFNTWPALATYHYDGWILRTAAGVSRRANSINPIYPSTLPLDEKIAHCEDFYRQLGAKQVVYKLTDAAQPSELGEALAVRGYVEDVKTDTQIVALSSCDWRPEPALIVEEGLQADWLDEMLTLNEERRDHGDTMRGILSRIPRLLCVSIKQDGETVAQTGGAVENGYLYLFSVIVAETARRQGLARRMMEGMLAWGVERGLHTAYLHVLSNNTPAQSLYAGLGFRKIYHYDYRQKKL